MKKRIKRCLSITLCVFMLLSMLGNSAFAASKTSGKCGKKAKRSYNKKSHILTISGKGTVKGNWPESVEESKVTIVIKKGITGIGDEAFAEMDIKKITLPNTLTSIGKSAVGGMEGSLPTITIPKKVKKIGKWAFAGCDMKSIKVAKGNKYFVSVDGVLFNKAKTKLISCPSKKKGSFAIPKGTKTIDEYAFNGSQLSELTVPASVNQVKTDSFMWAQIKKVTFKGGVPKGLSDTLGTYGDSYIQKVYFPEKKFDEWYNCYVKCGGSESGIEWYYF